MNSHNINWFRRYLNLFKKQCENIISILQLYSMHPLRCTALCEFLVDIHGRNQTLGPGFIYSYLRVTSGNTCSSSIKQKELRLELRAVPAPSILPTALILLNHHHQNSCLVSLVTLRA